MTVEKNTRQGRDSDRLSASIHLVIGCYCAQLRRMPLMAAAALLLPAIGEVLGSYGPPLLIARLLGVFARGERLTPGALALYVLAFASMWLTGQVLLRLAVAVLNRVDIKCMEALYVEALDELLARDFAFFHNNFAGSLTKCALGYARGFEDAFDVLCFRVCSTLLPILFVAVVLWRYSSWLIVILVGMLTITSFLVLPLSRHRRVLVGIREIRFSNILAGYVAGFHHQRRNCARFRS